MGGRLPPPPALAEFPPLPKAVLVLCYLRYMDVLGTKRKSSMLKDTATTFYRVLVKRAFSMTKYILKNFDFCLLSRDIQIQLITKLTNCPHF